MCYWSTQYVWQAHVWTRLLFFSIALAWCVMFSYMLWYLYVWMRACEVHICTGTHACGRCTLRLPVSECALVLVVFVCVLCCVAKRGYLICLALTNNSRHMHTECNGRILLFVAYFVFLFWVLFFFISTLCVFVHTVDGFFVRCSRVPQIDPFVFASKCCFSSSSSRLRVFYDRRSFFYCVLLRHRFTTYRPLLLLLLLCYVIVLCSSVCPIRWEKKKFHFNNILWIPHSISTINIRTVYICAQSDQMFCVSNVRDECETRKVTKIHTCTNRWKRKETISVFELDWIWFGCWCVYWPPNFVSYAAVTAIYFQRKNITKRNVTKRKWRIVCEYGHHCVRIHLSEKQFVQHWKRKEKQRKRRTQEYLD